MRNLDSKILAAFYVIPILLGAFSMIFAVLGRTRLESGLMLAVGPQALGILFLIYSKLPSIKAGKLGSFGPSEMDGRHRKAYLAGYLLIAVGIVLELALFAGFMKQV
jgi:hypothetical protein